MDRRALRRDLEALLDFWLGPPDGAGGYAPRALWFKSTPEFDAELHARFEAAHARAADGAYREIATDPQAALAELILLDQIPRNIFRASPRMYATDAQALAAAERALALDFDQLVHPVPRVFFFTPFEHSEDAAVQRRSLALLARHMDGRDPEKTRYYVERHAEIVFRFGRFPHRNAILGRATTPEEAEFLKEKDSSF